MAADPTRRRCLRGRAANHLIWHAFGATIGIPSRPFVTTGL